jgi:hypothetical protein
MAQPIQIILMRQLAGYLSVPLFLVGPNGDLLFYNEPAETAELSEDILQVNTRVSA